MMQQALNGRESVALQVEYMSTSHMEVSASYLTRYVYEIWTDFFKPFFIFFNYYAISLNFLVIPVS